MKVGSIFTKKCFVYYEGKVYKFLGLSRCLQYQALESVSGQPYSKVYVPSERYLPEIKFK